ncbi:TonB family protein [candidate division WOR-3 bacterium]|uniref:TonB family protein n=1 Tax=candidate division WOR-3 bacterium TaxID=2052148 RepID=A0A9D5QBL4_UNCW3|nr:TonB family protein [candidate division WOR-3 bacterium]MBD3363599.1 TonB family protein [candidate division WOR-3 bacterium]
MKRSAVLVIVLLAFAASAFAQDNDVVDFYLVEKKPIPLTQSTPRYPEEAREKGQEGTAIVQALVDTDGTIAETKLIKSSGYEILDNKGLDAAREWTFTPAEHEGKSVKVWVAIPFNFNLPGDGKNESEVSTTADASTEDENEPEVDSTDAPNLYLTPEIKPLEVTKTVEADYSTEMQEKGYEGTVIVNVMIEKDGKVSGAEVLVSSGYAELDEAAKAAALQFEFNPPQHVSGAPVKVEGVLTFTFSLEEEIEGE